MSVVAAIATAVPAGIDAGVVERAQNRRVFRHARWVLPVVLSLLSACATMRAPVPLGADQMAAAEAAQIERETLLRQTRQWGLSGRLAVATGKQGGSGRLEWLQEGGRFEVSVSAPVTRQSWRLQGDAGQARLEGLEGGPRVGADASALLREATGWDIPVVALADWVRGVRATGLDRAQLHYGADGRLARMEQGGWRIDYQWPDVSDDVSSTPAGPALPKRLEAVRGEAKVRLIIDSWDARTL